MKPARIWSAALGVALLAGLVIGLPPALAAPAASLPAGFLLRDTPTGLAERGDLLTDFTYLPDSSVIAVGKFGRVMWVPKDGAPRQLAELAVQSKQDLGLTGVAAAGDYAVSGHVFTARTAPSTAPHAGRYGVLRLSRWTVRQAADGTPAALADERTLIEISADADVHAMTGIAVAPDGTLWVSIGDSADMRFVDPLALRAGSPDDLHGKVLHLNPDGTGVATNPYYDPAAPSAPRSLVHAAGFRSPFRIGIDPATGTPIVGDVGWNAHEEINHTTAGGDYGWPCWEGADRTKGYRDLAGCANRSTVLPQHSYRHDTGFGSSVTGGVVYTGDTYPLEYVGRYFYADYTSGLLSTMQFDTAGRAVTPGTTWASQVGAPVALKTMPVGGDIVYADIATGNLRRVVYQPGNRPPTADIAVTTDPATGTVAFDAGGSTDPDGDTLTYAWDLGDGATATGPTAQHTYPGAGGYPVTLTVTDQGGASATATTTVHPRNHAPGLTVTPPDADSRFAVGDLVSASARAHDAEDGPVTVAWTTDLVHCRGQDCHSHPGGGPTGEDFALVFDGHPGDTRLEVTATATDSLGARASSTFTVLPRQRRLTVLSPVAADFTLGDQQTTTDLFTVGQRLTVIAPESSTDGVAAFAGWSDGAPRVRELVMPDADTALRVSYETPIDRRYAAEPALRSLLGAPKAVEQGDATVRWREYANGRMYWSPSTGVREVHGAILRQYLAVGGHLAYALPTSDEIPVPGGAYSLFDGGRSIVWSNATGARLLFGAIRRRWVALGAQASALRFPTTGEIATADGIGRYNHFQNGSIYWTNATGAHDVKGAIRGKWSALGWERSVLGYPVTGERPTPSGTGRYNDFQNGSIYWSAKTGAWEVRGGIRARWQKLGADRSVLGYPITDERSTPARTGRYNHFQNGSIYWTPRYGAFEVYGVIRSKWASMGWERSYLGYPITGEYGVSGGRRSDFQGGFIVYRYADRSVRVYRW